MNSQVLNLNSDQYVVVADDSDQLYEMFIQVAERCGYQFTRECCPEKHNYRDTELLWELLKVNSKIVLEKYLTKSIMKDHAFMYYDHEASMEVYANETLKEDDVKSELANKYYTNFVKLVEVVGF